MHSPSRAGFAVRRTPPTGWGATVDRKSGKPYYWHLESGRTTWFYPAPLPDAESSRSAESCRSLGADEHSALLRIAAREAVRYTRSLARVDERRRGGLGAGSAKAHPGSPHQCSSKEADAPGKDGVEPISPGRVQLAPNPFFEARTALPTWPLPAAKAAASGARAPGVRVVGARAAAAVATVPPAGLRAGEGGGECDFTESAMAKLAVRTAVLRLPPAPSAAPQRRPADRSSSGAAIDAAPTRPQHEDAVQEWGSDLALMLGRGAISQSEYDRLAASLPYTFTSCLTAAARVTPRVASAPAAVPDAAQAARAATPLPIVPLGASARGHKQTPPATAALGAATATSGADRAAPPPVPPRPPSSHGWGERALEDALLFHGKDITFGPPQRVGNESPPLTSASVPAQTGATPPPRALPVAPPPSALETLEARLGSAQLIVLSTPEEHAAALSKVERMEAELAVVQHQLREVELANYASLVRDEARLAVQASARAEEASAATKRSERKDELDPATLAAVELEIERRRRVAARSPGKEAPKRSGGARDGRPSGEDDAPVDVRRAMAQFDFLKSRGAVPKLRHA